MFRTGNWRSFLAGALCGTILTAVVGAAVVWWKPRPQRSAADDNLYDMCLAQNAGNTVACDAMMRVFDRERTREAAIRQEIANMLAAGVSKGDVVKWAYERRFNGAKLSDALGISESDLLHEKY